MKSLDNKINCPYCGTYIYLDVKSIKCKTCRTTINFDSDSKITDYQILEGYNITFVIATIISTIILFLLFIDAIFSVNTLDKLIPVPIIFGGILLSYLIDPWIYGYSRRIAKVGLMAALAFVLTLFAILNMMNYINYS